ncbi:hypothetical protein WG78_14595 [Amantichitinum ursilacus]|uniref:Uncharacterized protein n=1 Tax=Amantichitinum ursilacus TaxID=857265 RepID=A0A0N0XII6_9NEIS|nr:hypothetical protein WG78_14595 [Amantichitinum ursilacus]
MDPGYRAEQITLVALTSEALASWERCSARLCLALRSAGTGHSVANAALDLKAAVVAYAHLARLLSLASADESKSTEKNGRRDEIL